MERLGYLDYFAGSPYNHSSNPAWINGWTKAERASKCGWYDINGRPNASINKVE